MSSLHYRPEIDGLRAVAVLAVVVFHLDRKWLPGGFVGVDVFFVISGFLITSIIVNTVNSGSFTFAEFYQRRIARIFPALIVTALFSLGASFLLHTSWDFASTAAAFSASVLSIANIHMLMQGDYFELSEDAQPLLHYWSLSVEEQFYLAYPLLLVLILKSSRNPLLILGSIAIASFALSVFLTPSKPTWAFFLLPTRAWELLAGGILALAPFKPRKGKYSGIFFGIGIAILIASLLRLDDGAGFPGWIAAIPVFGTVLILQNSTGGRPQAMLGWRPLALIGKASYSVYLWHWPVFSFVDYSLAFHSPATRLLLKLALTALLSIASYCLVERPTRQRLNRPAHRKLAFALLGFVLISLGPFGYAIRKTQYLDASDGKNGELAFRAPQPEGAVILMGDSQATMYGALTRDLARELNLDLVILSAAGKDPLARLKGGQNETWKSNLAAVRKHQPDTIILACHWVYKLKNDPGRLAATVEALSPHARRILLLCMPPQLPETATRVSIRNGSRPPFRDLDYTDRMQCNTAVKACAGGKVSVIDVAQLFLTESGDVQVFDANGDCLFHDRNHLSNLGAELVRPLLRAELSSE